MSQPAQSQSSSSTGAAISTLGDGRLLLASLAAAGAYAGASLAIAPAYFHTPDDTEFSMLIGGYGFLTKPYPKLWNVHDWLSEGLVRLPTVAGIPVWNVYLLVVTTLSLAVVAFALGRLAARPGARAVAVATALLPLSLLVQHPQFTFAGGLLAIAAMGLAASLLRRPPRTTGGRVTAWSTAVGLLVLGVMTRDQSAASAAVLVSPIFLAAVPPRRAIPTAIAALLVVGAITGVLRVTQNARYTTPVWRAFTKQARIEQTIADYDRVYFLESTRARLARVGLSKNDFRMYEAWFFLDPSFDAVDEAALLAEFPRTETFRRHLRNVIATAKSLFGTRTYLPLWITAAVLFALSGWRGRAVGVASTALLGALSITIALLGRPPLLRVYFLFLVAAVLAFGFGYVLDAPRRGSRRPWQRDGVGLALVVLLMLGLLVDSSVEAQALARIDRREYGDLQRIMARFPNATFVAWPSALNYDRIYPVLKRPADLRLPRLIPIAAYQRMPAMRARLREFGIADLGQLHVAMVTRPDVYTIVGAWHVDYFPKFMAEHYGLRIHPVEQFHGDTLRVYRFEPDSASGSSGPASSTSPTAGQGRVPNGSEPLDRTRGVGPSR